ncbi:MAG: hypothetical protein AAGU16_15575, partial [Desulfitobacterium hafniense]
MFSLRMFRLGRNVGRQLLLEYQVYFLPSEKIHNKNNKGQNKYNGKDDPWENLIRAEKLNCAGLVHKRQQAYDKGDGRQG